MDTPGRRVGRLPAWIARALERLIRIGLALFFLAGGILKLLDLEEFARLIGDFGIVHDPLVGSAAIAVVALEIAGGLGLLLGGRWALALVTALLLLFLGVLGYGIHLGLDIECGCLGLGTRDPTGSTLKAAFARDLVLLAACGFLWASRRGVDGKTLAGRESPG